MNRPPTEIALRPWTYGQIQSERLCAALLHLEGYEDVDPQCPLGGGDGKKDVLFRRDGKTWIAAAYFPTTEKTFADTRSKFLKDFEGVALNSAYGFAFFTNQPLTLSERDELIAGAGETRVEIYHLERLRALLDSPKGCGIRLEYLRIAMTEEEQLAFWSAMNYDVTRKLLQNEQLLTNMDAKLDRIERTMALIADLRDQPSSIATAVPSLDSIECPTREVSVATVCWIHRIVTEDDQLPEAVRGRFRSIDVWIGPKNSTPETATFRPCSPQEIPSNIRSLLEWWHRQHLAVSGSEKGRIVGALAELHWRFLRIHPFLDANGRVARVLLDQAARELLNMRVRRELVADSKSYFEALAAADRGDFRQLERLVFASLQ
jgi:fido (protein-threonine AMPylation protein)